MIDRISDRLVLSAFSVTRQVMESNDCVWRGMKKHHAPAAGRFGHAEELNHDCSVALTTWLFANHTGAGIPVIRHHHVRRVCLQGCLRTP